MAVLQELAGCRIVEEVASGGMAVVYRAVQDRLNRTVAIKTLKSSAATEPSTVLRFEREAQALAALQHQNIIHVYDHGEERGAHYIIMEYVQGVDLYDLLDHDQPVPYDVSAIIALNIARALDYVHYRGILHRDIKPANIMVSRQGDIKLMDFGIARDASQQDLTEAGIGVGTPAYMSPEQVLGDKLDARSDLFSLGTVLYQLVTGHKPFMEDEFQSVMAKIREATPTPIRQHNPAVPRELEKIIERCLQKQPKDRFRSGQELAMALERFLGRHVSINYHSRLVLFLKNREIITQFEADQYLNPALGGPSSAGLSKPNSVADKTAVQDAALGQIITFATTFAVLFLLHIAPFAGSASAIPKVTDNDVGYVRLIANPWATVFTDNKELGTTPMAEPIQLPTGQHVLRFEHKDFAPVTRHIVVTGVDKNKSPLIVVDFEQESEPRDSKSDKDTKKDK